jgi:hypothetical protein
MAREFNVSAGGIAVLGATTLISINPTAAPNFNLEFLRFWVSQSANATSAQQRIEIAEKASIFPTLTTITPSKQKRADPNVSIIIGGTAGAIGTAGINATVEGAGALAVLWDDAFNVLNGWLHVPTPPETFVFPAGNGKSMGLYFPAAPATLSGWAFGTVFREV